MHRVYHRSLLKGAALRAARVLGIPPFAAEPVGWSKPGTVLDKAQRLHRRELERRRQAQFDRLLDGNARYRVSNA